MPSGGYLRKIGRVDMSRHRGLVQCLPVPPRKIQGVILKLTATPVDGRDARLAGASVNVNLSRKSSCLPNALLLLIQCLSKPIATKLRRLHSIGASG